jgi:hypothetical protein
MGHFSWDMRRRTEIREIGTSGKKPKSGQDNNTPYQGEKHTYDPKSIFER